MNKPALQKLVIMKIEKNPATARQLFDKIRQEHPGVVRQGFRSFVKVINQFSTIKSENVHKGETRVYLVK